ncbi:MAG: nuclear transport factor 2 family protein [Pseudomonadota bacterium]
MSALDAIERFYDARAAGDIDAVGQFIAPDVVWREPSVGEHMGELLGRDAVLDMMRRAQATTGGTFSLRVKEGVAVDGHCSVVVQWSATKNGRTLDGRELATFTVTHGVITFAQFLPENVRHDEAFWASSL